MQNVRSNNKDLTGRYSLAEELCFAMLENTVLVKKHFTPSSACAFDTVGLTTVGIASGLDESYNGQENAEDPKCESGYWAQILCQHTIRSSRACVTAQVTRILAHRARVPKG